MELLLVEDDAKIAIHLISVLRKQDFDVKHLSDHVDVQKALHESSSIDMVVLDRMLGAFDAKELIPQIREKWPAVPILVLSAISTPNERAELIDMGADDYLGKPFSTQELISRLRALVRRRASADIYFLKVGNLVIDLVKRIASVGTAIGHLTPKEFLLLRVLCQERGRVWSKNDLLKYVWEQNADIDTNVVEATVANLRKRLAEIGADVKIKNARNSGYWIEG